MGALLSARLSAAHVVGATSLVAISKKKRGVGETRNAQGASSVARAMRETVDSYAYFQVNRPLPDKARDGATIGDGDNCLTHSPVRLERPVRLPPSR